MAENKIPLSIAGLNLTVSTQEDEEYVLQIGREIDEAINAIMESSVGASVTSAVILCAIDYLDSCKKANRTANNMRNQIKEYMAEAANAKLQFDEEMKRNAELTAEIEALRGHLTRIATEGDTSGIMRKLKEEYTASSDEIIRLRTINNELTGQNKALTEKADAMNSYISGQDREIARLTAVRDEMAARLADKANISAEMAEKMAVYEKRIADLVRDNANLLSRTEAASPAAVTVSPPQTAASADTAAPQSVPEAPVSAAVPQSEPAVPAAPRRKVYDQEADPGIVSKSREPGPAADAAPAPEPAPAEDSVALPNVKVEYKLPDRTRPVIDIDLSDLSARHEARQTHESAPTASKNTPELFAEFKIEEEDAVVGFSSVPSDRQAQAAMAAQAVLNDLNNQDGPPQPEPDKKSDSKRPKAERKPPQPEPEPPVVNYFASMPEKESFEAPPTEFEDYIPPQETPEKKARRRGTGRLEEIIDSLDEDDGMPNLSWTLDL